METMEERYKTLLGTEKAWRTRMDGEAVCWIWRPLSGSSKDNRVTPHQQRNPRKARTSQLSRLLFELNRRVPNGMPGGVRGATC